MTVFTPSAVRAARAELLRLAVVLAAAANLTLTLGMIFPVQFALDTSGYRETSARTDAPVQAAPDAGDDLAADLAGARTMLVEKYATDATASRRTVGPLSLWVVMGRELHMDLTLMPDSTRVAGPARDPRDHGDWADISADTAAVLGIGPGDEISIGLGPTTYISLPVRGVYAVREGGYAGVAIVPAAAVTRHAPSIKVEPTALVTTAAADRVRKVLAQSPWREALLAVNYSEPFDVSDTSDMLAAHEEESVADLSLVLTLSGIAVIALLAIVVGESISFVRAFRSRAALLIEIGARPAAVYRGLVLALTGTTALAVGAGAATGTLAYSPGFAGPTLPPSLALAWWFAASTAVASGMIAATCSVLVQRKRVLLHSRADR